jgi:hypothetical protein
VEQDHLIDSPQGHSQLVQVAEQVCDFSIFFTLVLCTHLIVNTHQAVTYQY